LQVKVRHAGATLEAKNGISHSTARYPTHLLHYLPNECDGPEDAWAGSNSKIMIHLNGRDPTFEGERVFSVAFNQETSGCNLVCICPPEEALATKRRHPNVPRNEIMSTVGMPKYSDPEVMLSVANYYWQGHFPGSAAQTSSLSEFVQISE
jgi:hypothetical protein